MATVHVVGAGIAGLACAVRLVAAGRRVALYEAAGQAGGRCRSLYEPQLERWIDNGNHLVLGANAATMAYLETVGARATLHAAPAAAFPFVDLRDGARWTLRPNAGPVPWWLLVPRRRVPASGLGDYLAALRLARAGPEATVTDVLDSRAPFFARFWEPLVVAALNARPEEAAARLLWPVIAQSFGRGARACRAFVARRGLSASFVEPALAWLSARGCEARFGARLRSLRLEGERAVGLDFGEADVAVGRDEAVVLALPPARTGALLAETAVPRASRAILNAHFRLPFALALPAGSPFIGLIGGEAQWVFVRDDVASVTVSAADAMIDAPADDLAARLWPDVAYALEIPGVRRPPYRVVKERRATFAQTPAEVARRPPARTRYANLALAGDWIDTGLPATIESAARAGTAAARLVLGR